MNERKKVKQRGITITNVDKQKQCDIHVVSSSLYEFTMTNKNGIITKSTIPCDDWLQANRVKMETMKSKNLIRVDFNKV